MTWASIASKTSVSNMRWIYSKIPGLRKDVTGRHRKSYEGRLNEKVMNKLISLEIMHLYVIIQGVSKSPLPGQTGSN